LRVHRHALHDEINDRENSQREAARFENWHRGLLGMRMQNRRLLNRLAFLYTLDWCVKPICIIAGRSGGKLRRKRVTGQAFLD
jgi:hypothetical protein